MRHRNEALQLKAERDRLNSARDSLVAGLCSLSGFLLVAVVAQASFERRSHNAAYEFPTPLAGLDHFGLLLHRGVKFAA